ncbi:MAG: TraB/GumN family protein [Pseudomonadota bacterium]
MKLKFLSAMATSLALFFSPPAFAQNEATPKPAAIAEADGPALWKVADEDTTIYLFGTIHVLPDGLDWYDEEIAEALESADLVVKELGPDAFAPRKLRAALITHGLLPEGPTLRERMTQEQREIFEAEMEELGMDPETMDRSQPWFASTRIVLARLKALGIDSSKGVEAVLDTKVPDTPRAGLETVDLQFGAFASVPFEGQMKQLMGSFVEPDELEEAFDMMVTEWIEGDPEELAAIFNESTTESGLEKPLLYDRNANWAQWIETRLEQPGTVFMAVGAGHLAGKNSVQHYLNEREIGVERIR